MVDEVLVLLLSVHPGSHLWLRPNKARQRIIALVRMAWINQSISRNLWVSHLYRRNLFLYVCLYHGCVSLGLPVSCITYNILPPMICIALDEWIACLSINNSADIAILVTQTSHHFNLRVVGRGRRGSQSICAESALIVLLSWPPSLFQQYTLPYLCVGLF